MKYKALTLKNHLIVSAALLRIFREAFRLQHTLPTVRHQKDRIRILTSAQNIWEDMKHRAYKDGFDGSKIYCMENKKGGANVRKLLDQAGWFLAEAIGAMKNSSLPVDERAVRVLAFWIGRLMEDAQRGASH